MTIVTAITARNNPTVLSQIGLQIIAHQRRVLPKLYTVKFADNYYPLNNFNTGILKMTSPHNMLWQKGNTFKELHELDHIFLMPNAWSAGSACILQEAGFPAIGTTSAGIAYDLGMPDYVNALSRDKALEATSKITQAVHLPISADAENGYGNEPADVAQTIQLFAESGVVGASIEDYSSNFGHSLYDRDLAVSRIKAAKEAAQKLPFPFVLTARAECYLINHPNPLNESIQRANLYREAGADCLFIPGISDAHTIATLVKEIDAPLSVVMGLTNSTLTLNELEQLGIRRVSVGGSLARATYGLIRKAAHEMLEQGTFTFADAQIPDNEMCRLFEKQLKSNSTMT